MNNQELEKAKALLKFCNKNGEIASIEKIKKSEYDENIFIINNDEYLILTDEEANEKASEAIRQLLWAFNANFIIDNSEKLTNAENYEALSKAISKMQEKLCEDANDLVFALIDDFDDFVKNAIEADGRGHFLSGYDGEENEQETENNLFYIYKQ